MPDDFLQYLIDRLHRRSGTTEVHFDSEGRPQFVDIATGQVHATHTAAKRLDLETGITGARSQFDKLGSSRSSSGTQHSGIIEVLQQRLPDHEIVFETYDLDQSSTREFIKRHKTSSGKMKGFIMPDTGTTSVLRIKKGGKELTYEQIVKVMERELDFFMDPGGLKRVRGLFNPVKYSATTSNPVSAFALDPSNLDSGPLNQFFRSGGLSDKTMKHALDGAVVMNPRMVNLFIRRTQYRADEILADYGFKGKLSEMEKFARSVKVDTLEDAARIQTALGHIADARELAQAKKGSGEVFNLRAYGLDVEGADGTSLKGNVIIGAQDAFNELEQIYNREFTYIGGADNFKSEGGLGGAKGTFHTLDPRRGSRGKNVYLDIDTMLTHQDFYDPADMEAHARELFRQNFAEIEAGRLPENLRKNLQNLRPDILPGDPLANILTQERQGWESGLAILEQAGLSVSDHPTLIRQLLGQHQDMFTGKNGRPRLPLPDAIRGEVLSEQIYKQGVLPDTAHKKISPMVTDILHGDNVVLSDLDTRLFHKAFGGFDLDDALISMVRWDEKQKRLKLVMSRQPTGIGEQAVFDIDARSRVIDTILEQRGDDEAQLLLAQRNEARRVIDQIDGMLQTGTYDAATRGTLDFVYQMNQSILADEQALSRVITHHKDTDQILAKSVIWNQLDEVSELESSLASGTLDAEATKQAKRELAELKILEKKAVELKARTGYKKLGVHPILLQMQNLEEAADEAFDAIGSDYVIDQLERVQKTKGLLGRASNARMIVASVINDNWEEINQLDDTFAGSVRYFEQENVIDAMTKLLTDASGDSVIESGIEEMYKDLGRLFGGAADQGVNLTIDSKLLAVAGKGGAIGSMVEGLGEISKTLKITDFMAEEGRYSEMTAVYDRLMQDFDDETATLVDAARLAGGMENVAFSFDDMQEAKVFSEFAGTRMRAVSEFLDSEDQLDEIFPMFGMDDVSRLSYFEANKDILQYVGDWADEADDVDAFLHRFGAMMQHMESGKGGRLQNILNKSFYGVDRLDDGTLYKRGVDMSYLSQATQAYFNVQSHEAGRVLLDDEIYQKQLNFLNEARTRIGAGEILDAAQERVVQLPGATKAYEGAKAAAAAKYIRRESDEATRLVSLFDKDLWSRAFRNPTTLKVGAGLLGLVGFSFAYQSNKGRSAEDMQGPSNLPGGSAYEQIPPPQLNYSPPGQYSGSGLGTNYQIQMRGDFNSSEMADSLSALTGSDVHGTMYKRNQPNFDSSYGSIAGQY